MHQYFANTAGLICASALCLSMSIDAFADQLPNPVDHRVNVAVSLMSPFRLIIDDAICKNDRICNVISDQEHGIYVTVKLRKNANSLFGDLTVRCRDDCSFANGKRAMTFRGDRKFDLFQGADGIEIPLVLKPRTMVGEMSLIVEKVRTQ